MAAPTDPLEKRIYDKLCAKGVNGTLAGKMAKRGAAKHRAAMGTTKTYANDSAFLDLATEVEGGVEFHNWTPTEEGDESKPLSVQPNLADALTDAGRKARDSHADHHVRPAGGGRYTVHPGAATAANAKDRGHQTVPAVRVPESRQLVGSYANDAEAYELSVPQAEREQAAKDGQALPDGSFPMRNRGELMDALQSWGRAVANGKGAVVKNLLLKRAKALGVGQAVCDKIANLNPGGAK